MTRRKIERLNQLPGTHTKPRKLPDGELYKRPEPNPFTAEWLAGYADAMDGLGYNPLGAGGNPQNYRDGYHTGEAEKAALETMGSSNA